MAAVSVALLIGFWVLEHRRESPLVDFSLFRNRPYLGATAAAFALVGAYWVVMYFQPQYLQEELGYGAVAAGALILPVTVPMAVFSPFSGRLIAAFGPRATMTVGMLFGLAGIVLQALTVTNGSYAAMIPGFAASASHWRSSTRRCRPPRWPRCRVRSAGSPPACSP